MSAKFVSKTSEVERKTIERLRKFTNYIEGNDVIPDKFTCRKVVLDLKPQPYTAEQVRRTRELLGVSQALFAELLGVTTGTVQSWEQEENRPQGIACRFMDEFQRDPKYWRKRIIESAKVLA